MGLGEHVVLSLTEGVVEAGSQVFFDNFFSSTKLLLRLRDRGVFACGTFRSNKKDLPPEVKVDNKLQHGSFLYRSKGAVSVYQWRDSKNVHVMSNYHDPQDEATVERKLPCGKKIRVTCPKAVKDYNQWMGGVDRFDQKRNAYVVDRRSKKGWHRIFYFMVDAAIVNAFIQHAGVRDAGSTDLLHFKLILGRQLIERQSFRIGRSQADYRRKNGRHSGSVLSGVPDEVRFQGNNHFPKPSNTRRRCRWCSTKRTEVRTKLMCAGCEVPLCMQCFSPFHLAKRG